jgi:hypothetical protein
MKTKLYGLVEGIFGSHITNMTVEEVLAKLPENVKHKCVVKENEVYSFSACDG